MVPDSSGYGSGLNIAAVMGNTLQQDILQNLIKNIL